MDIIKLTQDWCVANDTSLLYLVKFGSHLYGTNSPKSDTDYKGLFLPSKQQCYLNNIKKSFNYSTGDGYSRNNVEDVDIQLWSLQYFIKLVSAGETNALDLLYSHTYQEMILYSVNKMSDVFNNHNKLFSSKDCNAYIGYAIGQAKKYGIKGSRLGVLKKLVKFLNSIPVDMDNDKLITLIPAILTECYDDSYCFSKELNGVLGIIVCGKVHQSTIKIVDFKARILNDYLKYGERAEKAEKSEGIDWKALSHAVRAINQMVELLNYGKIQYPLNTAPILKKIKNGEFTFPAVEQIIIDGLKEVDILLVNTPHQFNIKNQQFIDNLLLSFYE